MNRLFPLPLFTFLKIVSRNGGFSGKGLLNSLPWLMKTILFEPLRWIELATKNKLIKEHTITKPPVFILGFYRSGTTYLQQLFMEDNRLGYHSNFQMIFPEIMLTGEKRLIPVLEFISRAFRLKNHVHRVPLTWYKSPGEEDVAMTAFLDSHAAQWGYFFPERMQDYFEKYVSFENISEDEIEKWKQSYSLLIKKISMANAGRQLILKSPPNTARIKQLLTLYPQARFIHIHRNPYDVYASNKRLWKVVQDIYTLGNTKSFDAEKIILGTYLKTMQRYFEYKEMIPEGHLIEIRYEHFIKDPVATMQNIYSYFNLGNFNDCENKITDYVEKQKRYVTMNHRLSDHEIKTISEKWESVIRHLDYPAL